MVASVSDKRPKQIQGLLTKLKGKGSVLAKIKKAFPGKPPVMCAQGIYVRGEVYGFEDIDENLIPRINKDYTFRQEKEIALVEKGFLT